MAGALVCLALAAVPVTGAEPVETAPAEFPPEVPRMVAFELFAPPATTGG